MSFRMTLKYLAFRRRKSLKSLKKAKGTQVSNIKVMALLKRMEKP